MHEYESIYRRACREWERYAESAGIRAQLRLIRPEDSSDLAPEGYIIRAGKEKAVISSPTGQGLLYGVFHLIRRCRLAGGILPELEERQEPAFAQRMLWSWGRIDDTYRHPPYLNLRSMINIEHMQDPESSPEMMRFLRHMASMGVNSLAVTHELHHFELEVDQHGFRPYYSQLRAFSEYLAQWGVKLYLYTASAPEKQWKQESGDTDCPFDPRVEEFYQQLTEELFEEIPLLGGLVIAGGLGGYAGGSLYNCACVHCAGKSALERVRRQIILLAELLEGYSKQLIYTVTTDVPFTMNREVDAVLKLASSLPDNVLLSFKDCYHDFEELRYPEHPLFGRLEELLPEPSRPLAVEYQLFPEMRGKGIICSSAAPAWCEYFRRSAALKMRGVLGITETHPDDAHFSMADWYTWGRLCWEPELTPGEILREWALLEYPVQAEETLGGLLERSYEAAGKLLYAAGVQCGIHGMIIPFPHVTRDIMNDTWCPWPKRPEGVLGNEERQLALYTPERERRIREDPAFELFVTQQQVTPELKQTLMAEKEQALELYQELLESWRRTERFFQPGDYRYEELLRVLQRNATDCIRLSAYFSLFLDWQMGIAGLDGIQRMRREFVGASMDCSVNTCDELMDAFLTHLEQTLRGEEFDKAFDCVYDLPQFTQKSKLWQEGSFLG